MPQLYISMAGSVKISRHHRTKLQEKIKSQQYKKNYPLYNFIKIILESQVILKVNVTQVTISKAPPAPFLVHLNSTACASTP
jgi:hypothetical protein